MDENLVACGKCKNRRNRDYGYLTVDDCIASPVYKFDYIAGAYEFYCYVGS